MKKRILSLLLALVMGASTSSMCACSNKESKETEPPVKLCDPETSAVTKTPETDSPIEQAKEDEDLIKITSAEAKEILLLQEDENAYYIDMINWHERDQVVISYLYGYGAIILLSSFGMVASTDVIPVDDNFDATGLTDWLVSSRINSSVSIDVQRLTEEQRAEITETLMITHSFYETIKQYLFTAQTPPCTDEHIRPLTAEDKDAFTSMEFIQGPNRPTQEILFNHYVTEKIEDGEILAYFEDGKILGYLSYYSNSENYCANDYLYIALSQKSEELENKLIDAYIERVMQTGRFPLWSADETEIPVSLTDSDRFTVISEIMYFDAR